MVAASAEVDAEATNGHNKAGLGREYAGAKDKDNKEEIGFIHAQVHRVKQKLIAETIHCVLTVVVLAVTVGACVLCLFYCPLCLPAITLVSCCMCPWANYFNIPLWGSILLFIYYFCTVWIHKAMALFQ